MNTFFFAKIAALEELAEMIDAGASVADCADVISETFDTPISKHASEEDLTARLGIESACYDFLKEASTYYGLMEVNDEYEALCDIIEKVASDTAQILADLDGPDTKHNLRFRAEEKGRKAWESMKALPGKASARFNNLGTAGKAGVIGGGVAGLAGLGYLGHRAYQARQEDKNRGR